MDNPFGTVVGHWEDVVADMEATAAEYEEDGRETVQLHPGDVTVVDDPGIGFDVVVPGEEFDRLREVIVDRGFDSYGVFRGEGDGMVFCLVVVEDEAGEVAVLVPVYYGPEDREQLQAADGLATYVRDLTTDEAVTFTHDDPDPFFPDEA